MTYLEADKHALEVSSQSETKSSAGDKYETGRAMIQLELDKLKARIHNARLELDVLNALPDTAPEPGVVRPGSVVHTDKGIFFLSVSLGKIEADVISVFCVSTSAPIGGAMLGKKVGESFAVNGNAYKVLNVE